MSNIETIITSVLSSSVVAFGLLKWLGGRFIDHRLAKDLDKHKDALEQKLEALRTRLGIYEHEQQVAITRVDKQRADAIRVVYSAIIMWDGPVSKLVIGCPIQDGDLSDEYRWYHDLAEQAHEAGLVLAETLSQHAIYLDNHTYELVAETVTASGKIISEFLMPIREGEAVGIEYELIHSHMEKGRDELEKLYRVDIQPMIKGITGRFRQILGIQGSNI